MNKELAVTYKNFKWQLDYLKKKNYQLLSMSELLNHYKAQTLNEKMVVITFDDGYEEYYTYAVPLLKKHEFPSINYIATGYIETENVYWWDQDIGISETMNWDQLLKLSEEELVDIGAHTVSHLDLDRLSESDIEEEIVNSKRILEGKLQMRIRHFSYPRGQYNQHSVEQVQLNYQTGVLIFDGVTIDNIAHSQELSILKRLPVQRSDGKILFIARLKGWLIVEEFLRKILKIISD
ncbi:polysaccharide deacetylase family protein [Bacillaceae bacterium W0354]